MKAAVIIDDSGFSNIDLSRLECGNPGIGGTWFEMGLLLRFLPDKKDIEDVIVFHKTSSNKFARQVDEVIYSSMKQLAAYLNQKKPDIVITRNDLSYAIVLEKIKMPFILWAHNFLETDSLAVLMSFCYLKKIVFVGKEQYDRYIDHPIIRRCTFIYNMFDFSRQEYKRDKDFPLWVTYTGSLKREKGFHVLARHWKKIVRAVPQAQLHVIGSGRVYDRKARVGKYQIADEVYEDKFMKYLSDDKGNILPSVFFMGLWDRKKKKYIKKLRLVL